MSTILYRAREIVTLDGNCPSPEVVAVRNERILHVGSFDEVREALRDHAYEVDDRFLNAVIVPGFIEAHGHLLSDGALGRFVWTGFDDRRRPDGQVARGCATIDDVVERLRTAGANSGDTVTGYGFDPVFFDGRSLRRDDLDRVSTSHGVLVINASGHLAYANSELMRRRNVDRSTDARGVMRDADGLPTGEFHETAMGLVMDPGSMLGADGSDAIAAGAELVRQAGVTTASDLSLFCAGEVFEQYATMASDPAFPVRVCYSPNVNDMLALFDTASLFERMCELRARSNDRFTLGPLKWIADGSIQGFTGKLKWPGYCAGEDHGFLILDEDQVVEQLLPYHRAGFQAAIHTNGDEATDVVLRAIERVLAEAPRFDHRHRLEHCQMASRAAMRKMARLGVGANLFSNHVYYWGDVHRTKTMGPDRARRMDAAATALAEGVAISLHSDHPVTPVDPLFTMWCAVNRRTRSGHELGAAERITPLQALSAVTLGSAYLMKRDDVLGSIEVGKWADFTVLGDNPLDVDPLAIKDIEVVATVVAGRPIEPAPRRADA